MERVMLTGMLLFIFAAQVSQAQGVGTAGIFSSADDWTGFGNLEALALKPFAPTTMDLGAGVGLQITTIPANWWLVGGRKLFVDGAVLLSGEFAWGGSISLQPSSIDDTFRIGLIYSEEQGVQAFLGKAFAFNW
jgi:hypothetical protein